MKVSEVSNGILHNICHWCLHIVKSCKNMLDLIELGSKISMKQNFLINLEIVANLDENIIGMISYLNYAMDFC